MRLNLARRLNQTGDTIVEVMIVLAILGLAIGISYGTATRSLKTTRSALENSQATALLQGQIELLRANSDTTDSTQPNYIYLSGTLFCFNPATSALKSFSLPAPGLTNFSAYPSECTSSYYHIAISYNNSDDTFTATAYWDDVNGRDTDSAELLYRVHQP
jgi:type II secretory pathway pseudopilin PulG